MLFCFHRDRDTLRRALHAAVAAHRSDHLRELLARQGEARFAGALATLSPRARSDALSMLQPDRRVCVIRHLPRALQTPHRKDGLPTVGATRSEAAPAASQGLNVWGNVREARRTRVR